MKKKIIIGSCVIAILAIFSTVIIFNVNTGKSKFTSINGDSNGGNAGNVLYSEIRYNEEELINNSDLIVRCIFTGEKETKKISSKTKNGRGEETEFEAPVTTYKMKTVESLKGSVKNEFEVPFMGNGNSNFINGNEYVLFLNYNSEMDLYKLVSYNQGFNRIKQKNNDSKSSDIKSNASSKKVSPDETTEIESVDTKEVINYKLLKDKIKELEK